MIRDPQVLSGFIVQQKQLQLPAQPQPNQIIHEQLPMQMQEILAAQQNVIQLGAIGATMHQVYDYLPSAGPASPHKLVIYSPKHVKKRKQDEGFEGNLRMGPAQHRSPSARSASNGNEDNPYNMRGEDISSTTSAMPGDRGYKVSQGYDQAQPVQQTPSSVVKVQLHQRAERRPHPQAGVTTLVQESRADAPFVVINARSNNALPNVKIRQGGGGRMPGGVMPKKHEPVASIPEGARQGNVSSINVRSVHNIMSSDLNVNLDDEDLNLVTKTHDSGDNMHSRNDYSEPGLHDVNSRNSRVQLLSAARTNINSTKDLRVNIDGPNPLEQQVDAKDETPGFKRKSEEMPTPEQPVLNSGERLHQLSFIMSPNQKSTSLHANEEIQMNSAKELHERRFTMQNSDIDPNDSGRGAPDREMIDDSSSAEPHKTDQAPQGARQPRQDSIDRMRLNMPQQLALEHAGKSEEREGESKDLIGSSSHTSRDNSSTKILWNTESKRDEEQLSRVSNDGKGVISREIQDYIDATSTNNLKLPKFAKAPISSNSKSQQKREKKELDRQKNKNENYQIRQSRMRKASRVESQHKTRKRTSSNNNDDLDQELLGQDGQGGNQKHLQRIIMPRESDKNSQEQASKYAVFMQGSQTNGYGDQGAFGESDRNQYQAGFIGYDPGFQAIEYGGNQVIAGLNGDHLPAANQTAVDGILLLESPLHRQKLMQMGSPIHTSAFNQAAAFQNSDQKTETTFRAANQTAFLSGHSASHIGIGQTVLSLNSHLNNEDQEVRQINNQNSPGLREYQSSNLDIQQIQAQIMQLREQKLKKFQTNNQNLQNIAHQILLNQQNSIGEEGDRGSLQIDHGQLQGYYDKNPSVGRMRQIHMERSGTHAELPGDEDSSQHPPMLDKFKREQSATMDDSLSNEGQRRNGIQQLAQQLEIHSMAKGSYRLHQLYKAIPLKDSNMLNAFHNQGALQAKRSKTQLKRLGGHLEKADRNSSLKSQQVLLFRDSSGQIQAEGRISPQNLEPGSTGPDPLEVRQTMYQSKPKPIQRKQIRIQGSQDPNNSHMYKLKFNSRKDSVKMVRQLSSKQFKIEIKVDQPQKTNRHAEKEKQYSLQAQKEKQPSTQTLNAQKRMRTSRSAREYFQDGIYKSFEESPWSNGEAKKPGKDSVNGGEAKVNDYATLPHDHSIQAFQDMRSLNSNSLINLKFDNQSNLVQVNDNLSMNQLTNQLNAALQEQNSRRIYRLQLLHNMDSLASVKTKQEQPEDQTQSLNTKQNTYVPNSKGHKSPKYMDDQVSGLDQMLDERQRQGEIGMHLMDNNEKTTLVQGLKVDEINQKGYKVVNVGKLHEQRNSYQRRSSVQFSEIYVPGLERPKYQKKDHRFYRFGPDPKHLKRPFNVDEIIDPARLVLKRERSRKLDNIRQFRREALEERKFEKLREIARLQESTIRNLEIRSKSTLNNYESQNHDKQLFYYDPYQKFQKQPTPTSSKQMLEYFNKAAEWNLLKSDSSVALDYNGYSGRQALMATLDQTGHSSGKSEYETFFKMEPAREGQVEVMDDDQEEVQNGNVENEQSVNTPPKLMEKKLSLPLGQNDIDIISPQIIESKYGGVIDQHQSPQQQLKIQQAGPFSKEQRATGRFRHAVVQVQGAATTRDLFILTEDQQSLHQQSLTVKRSKDEHLSQMNSPNSQLQGADLAQSPNNFQLQHQSLMDKINDDITDQNTEEIIREASPEAPPNHVESVPVSTKNQSQKLDQPKKANPAMKLQPGILQSAAERPNRANRNEQKDHRTVDLKLIEKAPSSIMGDSPVPRSIEASIKGQLYQRKTPKNAYPAAIQQSLNKQMPSSLNEDLLTLQSVTQEFTKKNKYAYQARGPSNGSGPTSHDMRRGTQPSSSFKVELQELHKEIVKTRKSKNKANQEEMESLSLPYVKLQRKGILKPSKTTNQVSPQQSPSAAPSVVSAQPWFNKRSRVGDEGGKRGILKKPTAQEPLGGGNDYLVFEGKVVGLVKSQKTKAHLGIPGLGSNGTDIISGSRNMAVGTLGAPSQQGPRSSMQERIADFEALQRARASMRRSSLPEISPMKHLQSNGTIPLLDQSKNIQNLSQRDTFEHQPSRKDFTLAGATIEGSKDHPYDKSSIIISSIESHVSQKSIQAAKKQQSESRPNLHMLDILKNHQTTAKDLKKVRIRARVNSVIVDDMESQQLLASDVSETASCHNYQYQLSSHLTPSQVFLASSGLQPQSLVTPLQKQMLTKKMYLMNMNLASTQPERPSAFSTLDHKLPGLVTKFGASTLEQKLQYDSEGSPMRIKNQSALGQTLKKLQLHQGDLSSRQHQLNNEILRRALQPLE